MKKEYKEILEEMVKTDDLVDVIDGRKVLDHLRIHRVISANTEDELMRMGPKKSTIRLLNTVLPPQADTAMDHFRDSLKEDFQGAYEWLSEKMKAVEIAAAAKTAAPATATATGSNSQLPTDGRMSYQEKQLKLYKIFNDNPISIPIYVGELTLACILSPNEYDEILNANPLIINQRKKLADILASKSLADIAKVKKDAERYRHEDLVEAFTNAGF